MPAKSSPRSALASRWWRSGAIRKSAALGVSAPQSVLRDLVALHGGRVDALILAEAMRARLAALRPVLDHLVHLLERKQRPALALVPGLAALRSARAWPA